MIEGMPGPTERGGMRHSMDASPRAARLLPGSRVLVAAMLLLGSALAVPKAAHAEAQPATVPAYTMTPRRAGASLAVVVALVGAVTGTLALARGAGRLGAANGRRRAKAALVLGPVGVAGGGLVVATANGGLGTGNGLGGGVVAMLVGLIGMTLGGMALARSRRTG